MSIDQVADPVATSEAGATSRTPRPRRVLLVTGSMGEGHHAAARAVEEAARLAWPGADVTWTDALSGMGRGTGRAFNAVYAGCLRHLPWLYALHHWLLWHVRPFRAGTRAVIGAWSGRGLARALADHEPDLVVATFPEGVTGLGWLRRRGRLDVPAVALVADPAPHPLWADAALDLHLVSTATGADLLRRAAPGAAVRVAGLPVASRFAPPTGPRLRERPLVYVSCGSLAFGDVESACAGVLDAGADVLVSCGRDAGLRRRLDALARAHPRGSALRAEDWIDDPAAATRDADAVVTNAGGATALEALACARPLLLFAPIPGHGRANAAVLEREGLARICRRPADLTAAVAELEPPTGLCTQGRDQDFARAVASLCAEPGTRPAATRPRVRAQDALFHHAATATVPQQVGARIVVDDPGLRDDWPEAVEAIIRERLPGVALLHRRLSPGPPLRWRVDASPEGHVRAGVPVACAGAVTAFFAAPVDPTTTGWELQILRAPAGVELLITVHHALGDGLAVTDALLRLLTDENPTRERVRPAARPSAADRLRRAATIVRGIAALARAGTAGPSPVTGRSGGPAHLRVGARLDGARVRAAARAHGVGTTVLMLAVVADAVGELLGRPDTFLRTMVPMTTRTSAGVASHAPGNRTAAVSVALPLGQMSGAERVARVARAVADGADSGEPEGAAAVLGLLGLFPGPVQAMLVRRVYGRRFFHMLASVMPGVRRPVHIRGGLVREVYPVLPLADGVGLAVGVMHWGGATTVGITADPALVPGIGGIPAGLAASLDRM